MTLYSLGRARRAVFHTVGLRAVSQIATVLSYAVLVRGISEQSLGVYALLYSVIPIVSTVASLGLDQVLKRFQPEFLQRGNLSGSAWLVRSVALTRLISSAVLLLLMLATWSITAPLFKLGPYRPEFILYSIAIVLYFQMLVLQASLASHMLHRFSVGATVILAFARLIGYGLLWHANLLDLRAAILTDIAGYALAVTFLYIAHSKMSVAATPGYHPPPDEWRRLRSFAQLSYLSDAGSLLLYVQTDNFFVAALMSQAAVGAYAFYARLNEMTAGLVPIRVFENIVNPLLFSVRQEESAQRLPRYFTLLMNVSLLFQLPIVAFAMIYHREIVSAFFGGKFVEYSTMLPLVVAFATTNNVFAIPITMIAQYSERASLILKSQLFGFYQIAAMLTLVPLLGLYGAAIATGTMHLFRNLYVWWHVRDLARWTNWSAAFPTAVLIWAGAAGLGYTIKSLLPMNALATMACGAAVCAAATLLHLRSAALGASDRQLLANLLHGRESRLLRLLGVVPREASSGG
jgi:O-antigen/teichoic acid export membrane protein